MINKTPPRNRDYIRDPKIQARKRRGFINHWSTLGFGATGSGLWAAREKAKVLEIFSHRRT